MSATKALLLALLGTVVPAVHGQALEPPVAPRIPYVVKSPQGDRVDDYHWMRDDDPKVKRAEIMAYLRAEKAYADAFMAPLQPLKARLVAEMRARIKEDDSTVPYYEIGYWYWRQFAPGAEYPVYLRRAGTPQAMAPGAADEVLLDVPKLAAGKAYYRVGGWAVSPDNRRLAYAEDTQGRRMYTLRVRDLTTGALLPEAIPGVLEVLAWGADNRTIFYIRQDPPTPPTGADGRTSSRTARTPRSTTSCCSTARSRSRNASQPTRACACCPGALRRRATSRRRPTKRRSSCGSRTIPSPPWRTCATPMRRSSRRRRSTTSTCPAASAACARSTRCRPTTAPGTAPSGCGRRRAP